MDHRDEHWHQALEAHVDDVVTTSVSSFTRLSHLMLGLSLGSVLVGLGGILTLTALLDETATNWPVLVLGVLLMAAGPVVALRLSGLTWRRSVATAPVLGIIAWAAYRAVTFLF